jgi:N-acetylmuramoyl-L-alanine amidase
LLALEIQESAKLLQTDNNRTIKNSEDSIFLLSNINSPSVLVECGFLSNVDDAEKLKNEEYQKLLAFNIYCGISKYLEENRNEN